jgi:thiol-disulfide isomerase/thioredoxin
MKRMPIMESKIFLEKLSQNPRPVVVDIGAPWCIPCRTLEGTIGIVEKEFAGRVDLWKINADEETELLRTLGVYGVPTLIAFHSGRETGRRTGTGPAAVVRGLFESSLTGLPPAQTGPQPLDRILRWGSGSILLLLAMMGDFSIAYLLLGGVGMAILFSAVYDRCPVYRLISSRIRALMKGAAAQHD